MRVENVKELSTGKVLGERYIPAEVDVSIRPGRFYHADQDDAVKSGRVLDDIWFNSVGRNAMMLLNFPPNRDGVVCEKDFTAAMESNDRIEKMRSINYLDGATVLADGEDISDIVKCDGMFFFPERKIKELRLDIEALAEITVSSLALWKYEAPIENELKSENKNLMDNNSSGKIVDNNMGYSVLTFDGVYSFNTVEFTTDEPCSYTVYAFDGSKFYGIASRKAEGRTVKLSLEPVSSYQIKIETDKKFPLDAELSVFLNEAE